MLFIWALPIWGGGSKLGLAMWKFLAMRYHSASMREYALFHIRLVKKNHNFGPIFWLIFDRFLTIFVTNFNRFCARGRLRPNFVLFLDALASLEMVFRSVSHIFS